jgi:drug/metabolite transporter (DMT)-like permease
VPVFALVQAFVLLNERVTLLEIAGGAIILLGVRLATWRVEPVNPLEDAASA